MYIQSRQGLWPQLKKVLALMIIGPFSATTLITVPISLAEAQSVLRLPQPGTMFAATPAFIPAHIKGVEVYPDNPLQFDFIIDAGQSELVDEAFRTESQKLIKYFLAALTTPEDEMWVNLSPYEKNRIIPEGFGRTEMGRDMLAQDYMLKQLAASLMYPDGELGKKFWKEIHKQTNGAQIPEDIFNKIWIVPQRATVYEQGTKAYVVDSYLRVMLEQDYLAMPNNAGARRAVPVREQVDVSANILRETLIPAIEREVNEGKTFANLRQIYNALILATWFKQNLKQSFLGQVYVDKQLTSGVDHKDTQANQNIYNQYIEAFQVGVYDYIKEDYDPKTQTVIPRKYFSGGVDVEMDAAFAAKDAASLESDEINALFGIDNNRVRVKLDGDVRMFDAAGSGAITRRQFLTGSASLLALNLIGAALDMPIALDDLNFPRLNELFQDIDNMSDSREKWLELILLGDYVAIAAELKIDSVNYAKLQSDINNRIAQLNDSYATLPEVVGKNPLFYEKYVMQVKYYEKRLRLAKTYLNDAPESVAKITKELINIVNAEEARVNAYQRIHFLGVLFIELLDKIQGIRIDASLYLLQAEQQLQSKDEMLSSDAAMSSRPRNSQTRATAVARKKGLKRDTRKTQKQRDNLGLTTDSAIDPIEIMEERIKKAKDNFDAAIAAKDILLTEIEIFIRRELSDVSNLFLERERSAEEQINQSLIMNFTISYKDNAPDIERKDQLFIDLSKLQQKLEDSFPGITLQQEEWEMQSEFRRYTEVKIIINSLDIEMNSDDAAQLTDEDFDYLWEKIVRRKEMTDVFRNIGDFDALDRIITRMTKDFFLSAQERKAITAMVFSGRSLTEVKKMFSLQKREERKIFLDEIDYESFHPRSIDALNYWRRLADFQKTLITEEVQSILDDASALSVQFPPMSTHFISANAVNNDPHYRDRMYLNRFIEQYLAARSIVEEDDYSLSSLEDVLPLLKVLEKTETPPDMLTSLEKELRRNIKVVASLRILVQNALKKANIDAAGSSIEESEFEYRELKQAFENGNFGEEPIVAVELVDGVDLGDRKLKGILDDFFKDEDGDDAFLVLYKEFQRAGGYSLRHFSFKSAEVESVDIISDDDVEIQTYAFNMFNPEFIEKYIQGVRAGTHSFALLKPDGKKFLEGILFHLQKVEGFNVGIGPELQLSKEQAEDFYGEHYQQIWFAELIDYVTSDTVIPLFIKSNRSNNAVAEVRATIAEIRQWSGANTTQNRIHGSDSKAAVLREASLVIEYYAQHLNGNGADSATTASNRRAQGFNIDEVLTELLGEITPAFSNAHYFELRYEGETVAKTRKASLAERALQDMLSVKLSEEITNYDILRAANFELEVRDDDEEDVTIINVTLADNIPTDDEAELQKYSDEVRSQLSSLSLEAIEDKINDLDDVIHEMQNEGDPDLAFVLDETWGTILTARNDLTAEQLGRFETRIREQLAKILSLKSESADLEQIIVFVDSILEFFDAAESADGDTLLSEILVEAARVDLDDEIFILGAAANSLKTQEIPSLAKILQNSKSVFIKAHEYISVDELNWFAVKLLNPVLQEILLLKKSDDDFEVVEAIINEIFQVFDSADVGGIDFDPANIDMTIKRDKPVIEFKNFPIPELGPNFNGFTPIIIHVTPIPNLPLQLGLINVDDEQKPRRAEKDNVDDAIDPRKAYLVEDDEFDLSLLN